MSRAENIVGIGVVGVCLAVVAAVKSCSFNYEVEKSRENSDHVQMIKATDNHGVLQNSYKVNSACMVTVEQFDNEEISEQKLYELDFCKNTAVVTKVTELHGYKGVSFDVTDKDRVSLKEIPSEIKNTADSLLHLKR